MKNQSTESMKICRTVWSSLILGLNYERDCGQKVSKSMFLQHTILLSEISSKTTQHLTIKNILNKLLAKFTGF